MKTLFALAAVAVLSACSLTPDQKVALADATIAQIKMLNEQGIDPLTLEPDKLALLSAGCSIAPVFHPELAADITSTCVVIMEAAK